MLLNSTTAVRRPLNEARPRDEAEAVKIVDTQVEKLTTVSSYAEMSLSRLKAKKSK